jgi:hypothetical protein
MATLRTSDLKYDAATSTWDVTLPEQHNPRLSRTTHAPAMVARAVPAEGTKLVTEWMETLSPFGDVLIAPLWDDEHLRKLIRDCAAAMRWDVGLCWTVHSLRHGAGVRMNEEHGREAAQLLLRHNDASTTRI